MQIESFSCQSEWTSEVALPDAELVIYFASPENIRNGNVYELLRTRYPSARQVGCSSGGEIHDLDVLENSISGVAIKFAHSHFDIASTFSEEGSDRVSGQRLARQLAKDDLKLVMVLSDGLQVNGSELVKGFLDVLPEEVLLTGGLAGDGADFGETYVGVDANPVPGQIVALGLYGTDLHCSSGCMGGWQVFGPQRLITKAKGNILYELDDVPALDLYKQYLGEEAKDLPSSALLYPLAIRHPDHQEQDVVRTIVGVDEDSKSLIFAGDVPESYSAQLMTATFFQLADGAEASAKQLKNSPDGAAELAILISCIGRKLLMGPLVADEVDAVKQVLPGAEIAGFYSYGEIAPHAVTGCCEMHNQTMTITKIWEAK